MPIPKRCKLAGYAAGSPKLAFLSLVRPLAHGYSLRMHDTVKGGELRNMALAMQREQFTYISLLMLARTVLPDPEPILIHLLHGCIAMAFTACVPLPSVQSSHGLADTVKSGELSYMALALKREKFTYRLLLVLAGVVLTDPEPIPIRLQIRLVRGCIAMAFTAHVRRQTVMSARVRPQHLTPTRTRVSVIVKYYVPQTDTR